MNHVGFMALHPTWCRGKATGPEWTAGLPKRQAGFFVCGELKTYKMNIVFIGLGFTHPSLFLETSV